MNVGDRVKVHTDATSEFVIVSIDGEDAVIESMRGDVPGAVPLPCRPGAVGPGRVLTRTSSAIWTAEIDVPYARSSRRSPPEPDAAGGEDDTGEGQSGRVPIDHEDGGGGSGAGDEVEVAGIGQRQRTLSHLSSRACTRNFTAGNSLST